MSLNYLGTKAQNNNVIEFLTYDCEGNQNHDL